MFAEVDKRPQMDDLKITVATFNCEWRKPGSADAALIRERVLVSGARVVCLTETHHNFLDGEGYVIDSGSFEGGPNTASRRKVLLWSRMPWTAVDAVGPKGIPPGRYVAGVTETALGALQFMGVCIPYSFAGVTYGVPKRAPWQLHFAYLDALDRLLPASPSRTVILGDFNQRIPRRHQPSQAFEALSTVLLRRFSAPTAGVVEPIGRQAIDHICHSSDIVSDDVGPKALITFPCFCHEWQRAGSRKGRELQSNCTSDWT